MNWWALAGVAGCVAGAAFCGWSWCTQRDDLGCTGGFTAAVVMETLGGYAVLLVLVALLLMSMGVTGADEPPAWTQWPATVTLLGTFIAVVLRVIVRWRRLHTSDGDHTTWVYDEDLRKYFPAEDQR